MTYGHNIIKRQIAKSALLCIGTATAAFSSAALHAAGTPAGTPIQNTASATYDEGGATITVDSNTVTVVVDEILDIVVTSADPGDVAAAPGEANAVLSYTVTNGGNGSEATLLTSDPNIAGDDFDPDAISIFIDTNGNGNYDAGTDSLYNPSNPPTLAADETITAFILGDIPAAAADTERSEVSLTATASTGSGTPGTVFAGQGDSGANAVVGSTGATDVDSGFYRVVDANLSLTKSATVADQFGGTSQIPGATITYQLTSEASGTGTLTNVVITDAIPADTTYVANSITLDGLGLTDATDADGASFDGTGISISLGAVAAGTINIIEFQTVID